MEDALLFRRQFILSSDSKFEFNDWKRIQLGSSFSLSVHPDLEVSESFFNQIRLTLLGFVINPFSPEKSNQEILDEIAINSTCFNDVINRTNEISGRWIIIYQDLESINIFHDPCGFRQVYYYQNNDCILCGSDPSIINHFVRLKEDQSAVLREFMQSPNFEKQERAWVGPDTIFIEVKHLMPNHFLELLKGKAIRYWPDRYLEKTDLNQGVLLAAEILKGSLQAANKRYKLVLAVTAGWDSRTLLAASKEIRNDLIYFISVLGNEKKNFKDVVIPSRLFRQLNMPFDVQKCDNPMTEEFKRFFEKNVTMARTSLAKSQFIYQYFLEFNGKVSIGGNVSEIARSYFRPNEAGNVTASKLATLLHYSRMRYVELQLNSWIDEISSFCSDCNLNIYDMLYWEQRLGNWGALYPSEQDIAFDQFHPFNNRLLISTMLSVDEQFRIDPDYILYFKIIEKLWPDTLKEPINPKSVKELTKQMIKGLIKKALSVNSHVIRY